MLFKRFGHRLDERAGRVLERRFAETGHALLSCLLQGLLSRTSQITYGQYA
jgi:hypothetical protein